MPVTRSAQASSTVATVSTFRSNWIRSAPTRTSATIFATAQAVNDRRRMPISRSYPAAASATPPIAWTNESAALTGWSTSATAKPPEIPIERMCTNCLRSGIRITSYAVDTA